jgi:signal transduction histidine kinase
MKSRRSWWTAFALCIAVVLAALVWVTVMTLRLERAEVVARAQAEHQEALGVALYRMDYWLAPLLAQEAVRPYFDYQPFYPQQRAYTTLLSPIEPGEVLAPSPLLAFESDYFTLHYQIAPDGGVTSPQAPVGEFQNLAEGVYLSTDQIEANAATLNEISSVLSPQKVEQCVADAEAQEAQDAAVWNATLSPVIADPGAQLAEDPQDFAQRKGTYQQAQRLNIAQSGKIRSSGGATSPIRVGSLVPFWTAGEEQPRLMFTRRILVNGASYFQGFVCDWPRLERALLGRVADLFPAASLVPVPGSPAETPERGNMLATIPVALEVPDPPVVASMMSPVRWTLVLTWAAVLAGIAAVAVTLQASIAFGQKRSRFASAVTHELRSPLTTFQMYTEMLAAGMVDDDAKRREYLQTLHKESGRLANLVENVMAYARLEEGRRRPVPRATTLETLLDHVVPALRQRAESGGMELSIENEMAPQTALRADLDAVGQVLGNLVDNACKYAAEASDRTVHLTVRGENGRVAIRVRDHGPGIPARYTGAIFSPFHRGRRDAADPVPGLGLGLALARGLARDLGGDLELEPTADGACFRLTLPVG